MKKDPRNNCFYEDQRDCALNAKIEANFDLMLNKLINNPRFTSYIADKKKKHEYNNGDDPQNFVIRDGIYPGYEKQTLKVLFIGRDSHGLRGYDYSWSTRDKYLEKKKNDEYKPFDRTILSIAYCLSNSVAGIDLNPFEIACNIYKMINPNRKNPSNAEIEKSKKFLESFSFACINASKLDFHYSGTLQK